MTVELTSAFGPGLGGANHPGGPLFVLHAVFIVPTAARRNAAAGRGAEFHRDKPVVIW
jgi:hypothetical protein